MCPFVPKFNEAKIFMFLLIHSKHPLNEDSKLKTGCLENVSKVSPKSHSSKKPYAKYSGLISDNTVYQNI